MEEIVKHSLTELQEKRDKGELTAEEITSAFQQRIEKLEDDIQAFTSCREDPGEDISTSGPLAGIPLAIKDNMATKDLPTTCASNILQDYSPPYNATVVEKVLEAGAGLAGKANMDEFAMGATTEFSYFKPTRNPWDLEHVPGGSSGGSAAAVAAGMVPAALGSDTGGSIRQPAAFTGVVGLKPTYGAVSRYGLFAFASSLDQIGPLTRTVEDAAHIMNIISGHDKRDSTSADINYPDYTSRLHRDVSELTFGLPEQYLELDIDSEIKSSVEQAVKELKQRGAEVKNIELPPIDQALAAYYIIAPAEASSNLARYDGVQYGNRQEADSIEEMYQETRREGFGPEVKRRIMLGTYALSAGYQDALYKQALKVRTLLKQSFEEKFSQVDIIITPTTPASAFKLGAEQDPVDVYYTDMFTVPANITGMPGISLPAGFDQKGLPIGIQLIADAFQEPRLLQAASGIEEIFDVPTIANID